MDDERGRLLATAASEEELNDDDRGQDHRSEAS
jgi:hypothetical protein